MELVQKVCLVTGGTSGIGAAVAVELIRRRARVAVLARNSRPEDFDRLRTLSEALDSEPLLVQGDVSKSADCARAISETYAAFKRLDVIVHAAGTAVPGGFFEITEERWRNAFDVHVHAALALAQAAVPHMMRQREGAIILVGSAAGHRGCVGAIAYSVAKGALPQFARALARDLAEYNIRVNCVSPGVIRTPFQDFLTPEQVQNNIQNRIPLHREGRPEDVARAIVELIENDFITGQDLIIDGGMTMRMV